MLNLLAELTNATGLPGYEGEMRTIMERLFSGLAEVEHDNLGSVIARKTGNASGPRLMYAAHMDEIGFMVKSITPEGYLYFQALGGWWDQVMLAQRVTVKTRHGDLPGVIGAKPIHILTADERKKIVEKTTMFIDIGVADRAEAEAKGVRPGDPIVPVSPFTPMANENFLMAKAWDDRYGCAVLVEVLRRLQGQAHPNTVFAVATVQEEVGLRGATTSAQAVQPDIGIALDVSISGDTPGIKPEELGAKLGKGPVVLLYDSSMVPHLGLRDFVCDIAQKEGIPLQFDALSGGGTDAGRIHLTGKGVPSLVIGAPTRYIHSHASIVHRDDIENSIRLLLAVAKNLDAAALAAIMAH